MNRKRKTSNMGDRKKMITKTEKYGVEKIGKKIEIDKENICTTREGVKSGRSSVKRHIGLRVRRKDYQ